MRCHILTILLVIACALSGCATHNFPESQSPNLIADGVSSLIVDQNGTFYPNDWEQTYGTRSPWGAYSLTTLAERKQIREELFLSEKTLINNLTASLKNKKRIFILVHGYNNDVKLSTKNYEKIKNKVLLGNDDSLIEFYWDGLVSKFGYLGDAKIWFNATGYSQLAGAEGLRDILNAVNYKNIYIITHSRGASVALSALSNPPYNKSFAQDTLKYHGVKIDSAPLKNNKNTIRLLFLAPAIDLVDFKQPQDLGKFRGFGDQLVSISYTVNKNDRILKKLVKRANFDQKFNPTGLGYRHSVGDRLSENYKFFKRYDVIPGMSSHSFSDYIDDDSFTKMLMDNGILKQK